MPKPHKPSLKPPPRRGSRRPVSSGIGWVVTVSLVLAAASTIWWLRRSSVERPPSSGKQSFSSAGLQDDRAVFAQYGGSKSCRECHEEAFAQWENSNHALAERGVIAGRDQAAFEPPRSLHHGTQTSVVEWTNGSATVSAVGLSGTPETYAVARVIGNQPLRQFLVSFPGGRFQTLEAAYDPRSNTWFNVYGDEDRKPGEWGHWTGRGMNWNYMCASCHNTRLRRNYEPTTDTYHTTMAEMSVGCEACHGPLKAHNDWQKQFGRSGRKDPTLSKASRTQVVDNCGPCHARRNDLTGDFKPGDMFADNFDLVLVDYTDRYYADGQVRDEDYEYGSFLGSRMHQRGVICTDCHNPHSAKTILPGNWLCLRCHNGSDTNAPIINPVAHSFHKVFGYDATGVVTNNDLLSYNPNQISETGGECVNCHMPQTTYMQRHRRHDHGFTIPDPLLTKKFGIPNACNRCHKDQNADWALGFCEKWYGEKMNRPTRTRAEWIARARQEDPAAREALLDLQRTNDSSYWKAVLTGLLSPWGAQPEVTKALLEGMEDTNALVRASAGHALEGCLSVPGVSETLRRHLEDPSRSVRLAVAWTLRASVAPESRPGRELRQSLDANADQPGGQMRIGDYLVSRNDSQAALSHYEKAVAWDPYALPLRQQLAATLCALKRPGEAVETLREACRLSPEDAEAHYQLGLAYNESGNLDQAGKELLRAVQLNPRHARAWYNLGLAQNELRQPDAAIASLLRAESADQHDERIPYARATILAQLGQNNEAVVAARRALEINPDYTDARRLIEQLGNRPP